MISAEIPTRIFISKLLLRIHQEKHLEWDPYRIFSNIPPGIFQKFIQKLYKNYWRTNDEIPEGISKTWTTASRNLLKNPGDTFGFFFLDFLHTTILKFVWSVDFDQTCAGIPGEMRSRISWNISRRISREIPKKRR